MKITKFKTKEEAITNKNSGDRLFHDPYLDEYFIISPRKYIWKEDEFEDNFIIIPETIEECIQLRIGRCCDCEFIERRGSSHKSCQRRTLLVNRERMEIF